MTTTKIEAPAPAPDLSRLWQQTFDAIPDLILILDTDHRLLWLNRAMAARLGIPREKAIGGRCFRLLHNSDRPAPGCPHSLLLATGEEQHLESTIEGAAGSFLISVSPLHDPEGRLVGSVHIARDITGQRVMEDELRRERDFTGAILEIMDALVVVLDPEARIVRFNRACEQLTGYRAEEVKGKPLWDLLLPPDERGMMEDVFKAMLAGDFPLRYENSWRTREGERRLISWSNTAIRRPDGSVQYVIATGLDITERHLAEERLARLAHYDNLTELPNRKLFGDRLERAMARARRSGQLVAVLFLDLDRFKPVNDRFGHGVGDLLLKQVAGRLQAQVRETDTIARIGGDELVAAIEDLRRPEDAAPVARKIIDSLRQPFEVAGHSCSIGVSIGAAFYPGDGEDAEMLIKKADRAMYEAKKAGGNGFRLYREGLGRS